VNDGFMYITPANHPKRKLAKLVTLRCN